MKVLKFGGTSVGSAERIQNLTRIIPTTTPCVVVLSAMAGVTNNLEKCISYAKETKLNEAKGMLQLVEQMHLETCNNLFSTSKYKMRGKEYVKKMFGDMYLKLDGFSARPAKEILAMGESLSTQFL